MRDRFLKRQIRSYNSRQNNEELELYRDYLKDRDIENFSFKGTTKIPKLTEKIISMIPFDTKTWSTGDRFYKLAFEYYGNGRLWWIIAWFNRAPTEAHITLGEQIYIPKSADSVLRFF